MQENTNRAIAYNSAILYLKMAINTACALLTTRFALRALGLVDFGLFAVLGGIISFISIINTIMLSTTNRFIAVAIGKGDLGEANKQFNVNLSIHLAIALFVVAVAYPIGIWYIPRYVNYDGPFTNSMMVYLVSIVGCVFSFIGVPYNGLLMAKEKFFVFSIIDVVSHVLKLIIAWVLVFHFDHKLLIYTLSMAVLTAVSTVVFIIYCKRVYPEIIHLRFVRDKQMYKNVLGFSAWVGVGAVAQVGKNQGAALVVNTFFNTIMNTAMGVASSINVYVGMFAQNIIQPMAPQITKSYVAGNQQRTDELLVMSTKYGFLLTLLVGSIFLVAPKWLLGIWLGEVPPFADYFLVLFIVDNLIMSLNSGVQNIIFASGKIGLYQICVSVLNILSVVLGFFVLRGGAPAYYLCVTYICVSVFKFFVVQWSLHYTLHYDNKILWEKSYFPSLVVVLLFLIVFFIPITIHPAIKLVVSFIYLCFLEFFIGLSKKERSKLLSFVKEKINGE